MTTLGLGCGGQVETVVVGPAVKLGYKSYAGDPFNYSSANGPTYDGGNILITMAGVLDCPRPGWAVQPCGCR